MTIISEEMVSPEIRKCPKGVSGETPSRNISEEELLYITCLQDRILNLCEKIKDLIGVIVDYDSFVWLVES